MPLEFLKLEERNEQQLAARIVARTSGGLTGPIIDAQIAERRELLKLVDEGLDVPICTELTNANPSAPHTVILEAMAWALSQQAFRFNQVPKQNMIAFANLFGIEPRAASAATTVLTFTVDAPNESTVVTIPIGTEVQSEDGVYVFETTAVATRTGDGTVTAPAVRTVTGHTLLQPGVLTQMIDNVAFVNAVANEAAIDSGTEIESLESTLERVRLYQRRGERLVSNKDIEDAILNEALAGNGVVRVFPFIQNGDFASLPKVGHTTVVVMTKSGEPIDDASKAKIAALVDTAVGNQFIYAVDPTFVAFNVSANIRIKTGLPEGSVLTAVENNLRNFYAASRENFGRPILRSEIIAVIEGTSGVDRIVVPVPVNQTEETTPILASPLADVVLSEHQLPKLEDVTINVV